MTRRVLMVDDEEDVVWAVRQQIARERPDLDFEGVASPRLALDRIRDRAPDLLVTDVRMPEMSGLELMVAARDLVPSLPVVVITAYGSPEVRREVARLSSVEFLEKPFKFQTLMAAIDRALSPASIGGFSGAISVTIPDVIQLYALSQAAGALRVRRGGECATVWFEAGALVHAELDGLEGEAAVHALLGWTGGTFHLEASAHPPRRSITSSWQEVLLEGCRLLDEGELPMSAMPLSDPLDPPLQGPLSPRLSDRWPPTSRLGELWPDAAVLLVDLRARTCVPLREGPHSDRPWTEPSAGLATVACQIASGARRGTVEWTSGSLGVAVTWDREEALAITFVETLAPPLGASRFRSNVARWVKLCESAPLPGVS